MQAFTPEDFVADNDHSVFLGRIRTLFFELGNGSRGDKFVNFVGSTFANVLDFRLALSEPLGIVLRDFVGILGKSSDGLLVGNSRIRVPGLEVQVTQFFERRHNPRIGSTRNGFGKGLFFLGRLFGLFFGNSKVFLEE